LLQNQLERYALLNPRFIVADVSRRNCDGLVDRPSAVRGKYPNDRRLWRRIQQVLISAAAETPNCSGKFDGTWFATTEFRL